ncbi:Drug resistance transporter EmrB/QacA subfamily protein [Nostocoides japonicum T1-X7]|uniref:Drug resistance transporter EmrB/QacA subfamily protein n=1 Tax=Nostocoides japonicum T1-X7 TaxID=1194083 RepID=A0A077LU51_9MICO|nr:MDR family MFS transporter [Tetrasphaera japonica]CCH77243.1 Drug resistance transporter EmrB/QacA subfamily protein [Tetrasphaera japonica T1-X7]
MTQSTSTAEVVDPSIDRGERRAVLLVFVGLMVAMLLASLDQMIFSTALPTIVGELHGVDHMLWVTTAYILASTIMMPVYGKLGDLIGRKSIFVAAISLFMAGSVFGGLAHSMTLLIIGRAIQGLGGGGLMILSQAIIADVVPARQRGRYMGIMGGVFALASVAGPLLGGFFTEGIGWRWAFWMNLPLGALAIAAALFFLHPHTGDRVRPRIDVAGITTLAVASAAVVLTSVWGGTTYAWDSPQILSLIAVALLAIGGFVVAERRAAEPVMPLHLFRQRNFCLATGAGLIIGVAMFGAMAYLPTYLQMVTGSGATKAGLLMIPMMGGVLVTSMASGQVVSRTGRYKLFPLVGTLVVGAALALMSTMTPSTSLVVICSYLALLGAGIGLAMQILVLVVQNTFPAREVGTATAANNYFRQIGASLGSAIVGTVFVSRLTDLLAGASTGGTGGANSLTPEAVKVLPTAVRDVIVGAYSDALTPVFLYLVPLLAVAAVLLAYLTEKPLATTIERAPSVRTEPDGTDAVDESRVLATVLD